MPNDTLIYWDSCVFIDLIEKTDVTRFQTLEAIVASAERGEVRIVTSALSLAEVSKLKNLSTLPEWKEKQVVQFFENEYVAVRNVDRVVAEAARAIIRGHNIKPSDAVHVATALQAKVQVLHTYDDKLLQLDKQINYPHTPPLRMETPNWIFQPTLGGMQP
jgi:predicted nucleic acid-binding protein